MTRNGITASRFRQALLMRTAPATGVTLKMLAHRIRQQGGSISEDTVANYRDDATTIPAEAVRMIDAGLESFGFGGFKEEILGVPTAAAAPATPGPADAGRERPGVAQHADADLCWWATHEGTLHSAAAGLGDFARRYLDLPASTGADPRRFAIEHLGWLAVTRYADGSLWVAGQQERASPEARRRLADWLAGQGDTPVAGDLFAKAAPATEAAAALRGIAAPPPAPAGWTSERLAEDAIDDPAAQALWRAVHDAGIARAHLLETADRLGLVDRCALMLIDGDTVVSAHIGEALRVDRRVVGRPLLARRDLDYALRVSADVLEARTAPTVRQMTLRPGIGYRRMIFTQPCGAGRWQALSHSFGITADDSTFRLG